LVISVPDGHSDNIWFILFKICQLIYYIFRIY